MYIYSIYINIYIVYTDNNEHFINNTHSMYIPSLHFMQFAFYTNCNLYNLNVENIFDVYAILN